MEFLKDKGKGIKGETAVIVALDGVRRKDVFVDRGTTVFATLARKDLSVLVPGGTSTFREFSKHRNDRPIRLLC